MSLLMDPGEILRDYNAAANRDRQIPVLAELNCCKPMEIALCLRDQGAEFSATWRARLSAHDRKAGKRQEPQTDPPTDPAPELKADPAPLTAGMLLMLLDQVPGDTPVRILGSGVATSALFLQRVTAEGSSFVLEIQREEEAHG